MGGRRKGSGGRQTRGEKKKGSKSGSGSVVEGRGRKRRSDEPRRPRASGKGEAGLLEDELLRSKGLLPDRLMGKGAYSKVLKCRREGGGGHVAVKMIDRSKATHRFLTIFLPRELEVSKNVNHANVIRLLEHFTSGSTTCLVLELAARGDLEQYITLNGPFQSLPDPKDPAHSLFKQILDAMAYLHSKNIVHRDLKCENVFLGERMEAKVGDMGFAREMAPDDLSKTYCGSPAYAAPELLSQTPYKGRAADMWSTGVILYIMLSARMPFDDRNVPEMVARQKAHKIPFSSKVFHPTAKSFLQLLLQPDPELRPSAPAALANAFFHPSP